MPERRVCVIVNPNAGGMRARARMAELKEAVARHLGDATVRVTERRGHATEIARDALGDGFDLLVAVGGDGTASEVVNGMVADGVPVRPDAAFGLVPAGTGGDLARSLGVSGADADTALAVIAAGESVLADVIDVQPTDAPRRVCINVTGFGLNGRVVQLANAGSKRLGGRATFLGATLRGLATWRARPATLSWEGVDGEGAWEGALVGAFLSNGQYCGGGMQSGPGGRMDDGLAELLIVPSRPLVTLLRALPRLYDGTAHEHPDMVFARVRSVRVAAGPALPVDIDGETGGTTPATFQVVPGALRVVLRPDAADS